MDWTTEGFGIGREIGTTTLYDIRQVCSNFCAPLAEIRTTAQVRAIVFGISSRFLAIAQADGQVGIYSAKNNWAMCRCIRGPSSLESLAMGGKNAFRLDYTVFWSDVEEAFLLIQGK
jgi:hypothetical protein